MNKSTTIEKNGRFYKKENGEIITENELLKEFLVEANKEIEDLQTRWNSLREFVIQLQKLKGINQQGFSWGVAQEVLDKMNELEGDNNEDN